MHADDSISHKQPTALVYGGGLWELAWHEDTAAGKVSGDLQQCCISSQMAGLTALFAGALVTWTYQKDIKLAG